jgi:hypothetical protein
MIDAIDCKKNTHTCCRNFDKVGPLLKRKRYILHHLTNALLIYLMFGIIYKNVAGVPV